MEHEALTVSTDQQHLLDGAIESGQFESRSGALRTILAEYFRADLDRTAAIVAATETVHFEQTVDVLDVDAETFATKVREINADAVPDRLNAHLDQEAPDEEFSTVLESIEAELSEIARDGPSEEEET